MNKIKDLQLILTLAFTILICSVGSAQNMMQNDPSPEMETAVKNEVQKWEEELSLTAKQMLLMEKKLIEFAIKRDGVINKNLPEDEELDRLKDLKILQIRELRDILTQPQYDRYLLLMEEAAAEQERVQNR